MKERPSWDEYFLKILHATQERATCDRGRSAAVIVKENHIICTGYVGSPRGMPHCDEAGHDFIESYDKMSDGKTELKKHCIRTIHAEVNAICQAARLGIPIEGCDIYTTMVPCTVCAKMLINVGIKRVIAENEYQSSGESKYLFSKAKLELKVLNDNTLY